mmetsp:Transcript_15012/g.31835  ORF Transcript_15012/g.31835 Transcript_15012/m.31835 type:complete len:241 (-) Transcript_15012:118-840(-)
MASLTFLKMALVIFRNCFSASVVSSFSPLLFSSSPPSVDSTGDDRNIMERTIPATTRTHVSSSDSASCNNFQTMASVFRPSPRGLLDEDSIAKEDDPKPPPPPPPPLPLLPLASCIAVTSDSNPSTLIKLLNRIGFAARLNTLRTNRRNLEGVDGSPDGSVVTKFDEDEPPPPNPPNPPRPEDDDDEDVPCEEMMRDKSCEVKSALRRDSRRTRKASRSSFWRSASSSSSYGSGGSLLLL